jgi:hypothetical protein
LKRVGETEESNEDLGLWNGDCRSGDEIREVDSLGGEVRIRVVPTNEELEIPQETKKVIEPEIGGAIKGK